jgi:hypothetical protein
LVKARASLAPASRPCGCLASRSRAAARPTGSCQPPNEVLGCRCFRYPIPKNGFTTRTVP